MNLLHERGMIKGGIQELSGEQAQILWYRILTKIIKVELLHVKLGENDDADRNDHI